MPKKGVKILSEEIAKALGARIVGRVDKGELMACTHSGIMPKIIRDVVAPPETEKVTVATSFGKKKVKVRKSRWSAILRAIGGVK